MLIFGCLAGAFVAAVWVARASLLVVTVDGESMLPTYRHGDRLLARRGSRAVRVGQVVVFAWPRAGTNLLVKRVAAVSGDLVPEPVRCAVPDLVVPAGQVVVIGDGPGSIDSRRWGYLPSERIRGVIMTRLRGNDM